MTRPVVFLDFDGVILPYPIQRANPASRAAVAALNRITDQTGAGLVISSTWRLHGLDYCRRKLGEWGVTGDVIGETTDSTTFDGVIYMSRPRALEINQWLDARPDFPAFVILDDEGLDEIPEATRPWLRPFHIRPVYTVGLTDDGASGAIRILRRQGASQEGAASGETRSEEGRREERGCLTNDR